MHVMSWALILAVVLSLAIWAFLPHYRRARAYIRDVSTCGFLPPPPTARAMRWYRRIAKFHLFLQVGNLEVQGTELLAGFNGEIIVTPNHPSSADLAVAPLVVIKPVRTMAAQGVMTFCFGLGALIAGPMGGFAVDITPGRGGPAHDAAVRVLTTGQILMMFPEGHTHVDGRVGVMKKGAVRIAKESAEILGRDVYIVPMFLRYGRYPGAWINKVSPPLDYFLLLLLAPLYRRGVTVVIGAPIASSLLDADDDLATEQLRTAIISLDPLGRNGEP